mmetsp:Transcript_50721/g.113998  ORF Transcript_50721/g.113998 Transcript_50721/m.113998 type:complete len:265 (+) Transcript_50721:570-1364(+)
MSPLPADVQHFSLPPRGASASGVAVSSAIRSLGKPRNTTCRSTRHRPPRRPSSAVCSLIFFLSSLRLPPSRACAQKSPHASHTACSARAAVSTFFTVIVHASLPSLSRSTHHSAVSVGSVSRARLDASAAVPSAAAQHVTPCPIATPCLLAHASLRFLKRSRSIRLALKSAAVTHTSTYDPSPAASRSTTRSTTPSVAIPSPRTYSTRLHPRPVASASSQRSLATHSSMLSPAATARVCRPRVASSSHFAVRSPLDTAICSRSQ